MIIYCNIVAGIKFLFIGGYCKNTAIANNDNAVANPKTILGEAIHKMPAITEAGKYKAPVTKL